MNNPVKLYACGGTGINIANKLNSLLNTEVVFIDSSTSNLNTLNQDNTYLIEGMDGAGKLRSKTYEAFRGEAVNVLTEYKPSKGLNIVLSSLAGGTGSVIAPLLTRELLDDDKTVIVIGVGSDTSVRELENTVNALMTYNNFSTKADKPIAMYYDDSRDRQTVDSCIVGLIEMLDLITDKSRTKEFDSADLHNFINYNLVTGVSSGLSLLSPGSITKNDGKEKTSKIKDIYLVSTILVTKDEGTMITDCTPEYLAKVIVTDPDYETGDIRIDNYVGELPALVNRLQDTVAAFKDNVKTAKIHRIEKVVDGDDGMVL